MDQASFSLLIPDSSFSDADLRLRADEGASIHLSSLTFQLFQQFLFKFFPGFAFTGVCLVGSQTFRNYLPVPIRYRDLFRIGSNVIPERLHIVDLFLDCEGVKTWWR